MSQAGGVFTADPEAFFDVFYLKTAGARAVYHDSMAALRRVAEIDREALVVDVGCGGGHLLRDVAGRMTIGIDRSFAMITLARRVAPEAKLATADSGRLPLRDGVADVVLSRAHLQHVDDLDRTFHECARVLRRGGRLAVFVPVTNPVVAAARAVAMRVVPERERVSGALRDRRTYMERLRAAGLAVEQAHTYGLVVYTLSGYGTGLKFAPLGEAAWRVALAVDRLLLRLPILRWWGINLIATARKA
jgi:SAM-dependent methyltransferase